MVLTIIINYQKTTYLYEALNRETKRVLLYLISFFSQKQGYKSVRRGQSLSLNLQWSVDVKNPQGKFLPSLLYS